MIETVKCVVCGQDVDKFQIGHHYKKLHPEFDYKAYKESLKIKICPICGKAQTDRKYCVECKDEFYHRKNVEKSKEKYKDAPINSYVECKICGFLAENLNSHLASVHKTNSEDYRKKYNSPTCSDDYLQICSDKMKGDKNPGYQHDGKFSPFSDKFIGKATKEEALAKVKNSKDENFSYTTRLEYYTHRGYTQEEAELALKERQTTFSKDICVEKHGEEEGIRVWLRRQTKWFKSLNKSDINTYINPDDITESIVEKLLDSKKYYLYTYLLYKAEIDPSNLLGTKDYEMDHKLSKFEGYINDISVEVMSNKYNLQIISRADNLKKTAGSVITIEQLLENITRQCKKE